MNLFSEVNIRRVDEIEDFWNTNLNWAIGYNKDIIGGVHYLQGKDYRKEEIVYASGHTGVIYDFQNKKIRSLLQGHVNRITAVAVSRCKSYIATADAGDDSMLVVWDAQTGVPVKTYFDPHPKGVLALAFDADAKHIATLSAPIKAEVLEAERQRRADEEGVALDASLPPAVDSQGVAVWAWGQEGDEALCSALITTQDLQLSVCFNELDGNELATTGRSRVLFWTWMPGRPMQFYGPVVSPDDFPAVKRLNFSETCFVPNKMEALSATLEGNVVVWDHSLIVDGLARPDERRAVKVVSLTGGHSINTLRTEGELLVVGCGDMSVKFYDVQLRLRGWFEDLAAGPVTSVSFASRGFVTTGKGGDGRDETAPFDCPDFIVSTSQGLVLRLEAPVFYLPTKRERRGEHVQLGLNASCKAIATHPLKKRIACASASGVLLVYDYKARQLTKAAHTSMLSSRAGEKRSTLSVVMGSSPGGGAITSPAPTSIVFSPCGLYLAIGFANGAVQIRSAKGADDLCCHYPVGTDNPFSGGFTLSGSEAGLASSELGAGHAGNSVRKLAFSSDSRCLAIAHGDHSVGLLRVKNVTQRVEGKGYDTRWGLAGRVAAHKRAIVGLTFAFDGSEGGVESLFSTGEDRLLVQYSLSHLTELSVASAVVVDATALPTGLATHPPPLGQASTEVALLKEFKPHPHPTAKTVKDLIREAAHIGASKTGGNGGFGPLSGEGGDDAIHGAYFSEQTKVRGHLLIPTDSYKLKVWDPSVPKARRVVQAPTYGGPLRHMCPLPPSPTATEQLLAFAAGERFLGLTLMPLDGNPAKSMAVIAHPGPIGGLAVDHEGEYIFTCGGGDGDSSVFMWSVDGAKLVAAATLAGDGLEAYMPLLQGGRNGKLYKTLLDLFAYAQVRAQGEDSTSARSLSDRVAVSELPRLLAACGFFPSQLEIEALLGEVTLTHQAQQQIAASRGRPWPAEWQNSIDLQSFVKLFANHRPVFQTSIEDVAQALDVLAKSQVSSLSPELLTRFLTTRGEPLTELELASTLTALTGAPSLREALARPASLWLEEDDEWLRDVWGHNKEGDEGAAIVDVLGLALGVLGLRPDGEEQSEEEEEDEAEVDLQQ